MQKTVLILGSSGRFGRHATEAFWNAGWTIRLFDREADDLEQSAQGADVIVAAWNPIYPDWQAQVLALHARIQQAARSSGATVIVPGNVYVYGGQASAPWGPDTPHIATNPLGRIRIEMEESYRQSGIRTIILRAGDFIDTEDTGAWLDKVMLPGLAKGRFTYPGRTDAPHAWAYLPDLARAAERLASVRDQLASFADISYPGFTLTGAEFAQALSDIAGYPVVPRSMGWRIISAAQPFWPMAKHLLEMRYLWNIPHWLDGSRFNAVCPDFYETPVEEALRAVTSRWIKPGPSKTCCYFSKRSTQTIL